MKLILKQYLGSLREREELDAILPDLLSQLGLNVFSRPQRGTRQNGVDIAAVGNLDGNVERVYLFSIKSGDLTRTSWNSDSPQSLRPSLEDIVDTYIPNRLPVEHRDKEIVICICFGGDVQEQVRESLSSYIAKNSKGNVTFQEWNGDKIAELIQNNFLREDILPQRAKSLLRKSLSLIDDPAASYRHFQHLVSILSDTDKNSDKDNLTALRQISLCLWILFSWARDEDNMEAAYTASELALLHAWSIARLHEGQKDKISEAARLTFLSILSTYHQIGLEYLNKSILPHVNKQHALSASISASCSLDVNLKMFDVLGRLALMGLWMYWSASTQEDHEDKKSSTLQACRALAVNLSRLIKSNPILLSPIKDNQIIDISMGLLLFSFNENAQKNIENWLIEMLGRSQFCYEGGGPYPCILDKYSELLEHPKQGDEYQKNVTSGSVLYPSLSLWGALYNIDELYCGVQDFKESHLKHCNFQFWYPDEESEQHFYKNTDNHGAVLSNVCVDRSKEEFLKQIFSECDSSPQFRSLSAVKEGLWPIVLVACRHYRLPVPMHLMENLYKNNKSAECA
jgi:hypothetical protein